MFQISHSVMNEETLGWGIKWRAEKEEGIKKKKKEGESSVSIHLLVCAKDSRLV